MGFNHGQDSFMWPRLMPSQGHDFELSAISVPRSWEMQRNLWDSLPPPTLGMYQDQGSTHVPRQLIVWGDEAWQQRGKCKQVVRAVKTPSHRSPEKDSQRRQ